MTIAKLLNCYFELARNKLSYIVKLTNSIQRFNYSTIKRLNLGFTIIELLIVMSLLGIATTLVSAAYLSFEKRERVKSAALDLKSNLRLAQNKALSGDKGISGTSEICDTSSTLVGWFVRINTGSPNYEVVGSCQTTSGEVEFSTKTYEYPDGVSLTEINYVGAFSDNFENTVVNILFRPIEREVYFFNSSTPPFLDGTGNINTAGLLEAPASSQISLRLRFEGFDTIYDVNISTSGEINEKKI